MGQNHWWIPRPKRKLNPIPEELAAFSAVALGRKWYKNRDLHLQFEEELESTGTKRVGERRDGSGSGGRTHASLLFSLGLWFEKDNVVHLTLAGEAILNGKPPVPILKKQVLSFQYPSAYSAGRGVAVNPKFKVRPFIFLLKLLSDNRIGLLTQEEIAAIVAIEATDETDECFERVVSKVLLYRQYGDLMLPEGYFENAGNTFANLMDLSNTMMNWLDYTQLVYREPKQIGIEPSKMEEVKQIITKQGPLIKYPVDDDIYQRKYGLDPWHQKDTRNLLKTTTISSRMIDETRILKEFFVYSSLMPIDRINGEVVNYIREMAGTDYKFTEDVLRRKYPHGAIGGYLSNYRDMAFKGRDEAIDFEKATTHLFEKVLGFTAKHLGQTGKLSAPDVLLVSESEGYQAIIDNKAYSRYSISGDHHNRMVHNYIEGIAKYSPYDLPIGFFTYISGGFAEHIDTQIRSEVQATGIHGSGIVVSNLISLFENHQDHPYSHADLRSIFGIDRQILLTDI